MRFLYDLRDSSVVRYFGQFRRNARLFLLSTLVSGITFSGFQLFFNIYLRSRGFDLDFIGLLNALPSGAALVVGIPMGILSDRIGRRRAMLIGLTVATLAAWALVTANSRVIMVIMSGVMGVANSLYFLSMAPFMIKASGEKERTLLFSLNFGLTTLSGAVGNLLAGQLPTWFGAWLGVGAESAAAYQAVLVASVFGGGLALLPLWFISEVHWPGPSREPAIGLEDFRRLLALVTGIATVIGPRLAEWLGGKVRAVVFTQGASLLFLLVMGFSPVFWLSGFAFLVRGALMNLSNPLYAAFAMERTAERERGAVNSMMQLMWEVGWTVGPYLSGVVQARWGFSPLFIATASLYGVAIGLTWLFFHHAETKLPSVETRSAQSQ
jgi:MFS family permease